MHIFQVRKSGFCILPCAVAEGIVNVSGGLQGTNLTTPDFPLSHTTVAFDTGIGQDPYRITSTINTNRTM